MTRSNPSLRNLLPVSQDYSLFNREERNYAAILYHLLLKPGGLAILLEKLGHGADDPSAAKLYFEYAHARDLWCEFGVKKSIEARNQGYHDAIVSLLRPPSGLELPPKVEEFNRFFVGESPRASARQIQMPGRWSQELYGDWIKWGGVEFARRACKLKWAFNVKPDLVIQTSDGTAICVEIKVDSKEGSYSMGKDASRFSMTQTAMQKYVLEELLGYKTEFVFLSRDGKVPQSDDPALRKTPTRGLMWIEVFGWLMPPGTSDELPFVQAMTGSRVLGASNIPDPCMQ